MLSCLADDAVVKDIYLGSGAVLQRAKLGTQFIELSTVSPETSRQIDKAARKLGSSVLDVAISGSTAAAESGALTLFGGGERSVFEMSRPIFVAIAEKWFYMGASGNGVAMKLVVNALLGVGLQAIAEGVALSAVLDLPRDLVLDTLAQTAVVPPALVGKLAAANRNDYSPQFPVRLMRKDFGLILSAAAKSGLSLPATEAAAATNSEEAETGREEDFSAVIRRLEEQAKQKGIPPTAP